MAGLLIAMPAFAAGMQGYFIKNLNIIERVLMMAAGIALFVPEFITSISGLLVIALIYLKVSVKYCTPRA